MKEGERGERTTSRRVVSAPEEQLATLPPPFSLFGPFSIPLIPFFRPRRRIQRAYVPPLPPLSRFLVPEAFPRGSSLTLRASLFMFGVRMLLEDITTGLAWSYAL